MALASQLVQIPFAQGVDEATSSKHLATGKLRTARNVRFDKNGALRKRMGMTYVASVAAGYSRLASFGDEVVVAEGTNGLRTYSAQAGGFISKDLLPNAHVYEEAIAGAVTSTYQIDIGSDGNVIVVVWCSSDQRGHIFASVIDAATGAELVSAYQLTATAIYGYPRVVFVGSTCLVVYSDNVSNIVYRGVTGSSWGVQATLRTDYEPAFSFAVASSSSRFALAYADNAGASRKIQIYTYSAAPTQIAHATSTEAVGVGDAFSLWLTEGETLWMAYAGVLLAGPSKAVRAAGYDPTSLVETVAPFTAYTCASTTDTVACTSISRVSSTVACAACTIIPVAGGSGAPFTMAPLVTTGGAVTVAATARRTYWCALGSASFVQGGRTYAWAYAGAAYYGATWPTNASSQQSLVLLDLGTDLTVPANLPARPVGNPTPRVASWDGTAGGFGGTCLPNVVSVDSLWLSVGRVKKSNKGRTGLVKTVADFAHTNRWQPSELGSALYLSGGLPSYYDGQRVGEVGFVYSPESISTADSAAGGGLVGSQTFNYVVVPEWLDARGQLHQGQPSISVAHALTAGKTAVDLIIPTVTLTTRQDAGSGFAPSIGLAVYRTTGGSSGPYYRVFPELATPTNSPYADSITVTDTYADSSINTNAQLYTGNVGTQIPVVANVSPPSFACQIAHKSRIWGAHGNTLWFSKQFVEGTAPAFADEFTIPIDDAGDITGLASMDGKLIAFTANRIFVIDGDGPADSGLPIDYVPQRIASDLGCSEPRSVVLTPMGVMFLSAAGIYLLTRGYDVQYIGQPVQDTLAAYPTIAGATVHPSGLYVSFLATNGTNGVRILYDYRVQQWTTDDVCGTPAAGAGKSLNGQAIFGSAVYAVDSAGAVYRESDASYLDTPSTNVAAWVTMQVETSDMSLQPIQGFQRARRLSILGEQYTPHDLTIEVANDYSATFHQARTWVSVVLSAFSLEQVHAHLARQKCQAIRVRITDATPTTGATPVTGATVGTGRGLSIEGLALELGAKRGAFRVPEVQRS